MEAIAMRMTQDEFDSIKGLLVKYKIEYDLTLSIRYPYLSNRYHNELGYIGSISILDGLKVYEHFDKDIFLKACDIEVDNVWKGSEIEFRYNPYDVWRHSGNDYEFRLKPKPDYSKEIESLQKKAKLNGMKAIVTFEKI